MSRYRNSRPLDDGLEEDLRARDGQDTQEDNTDKSNKEGGDPNLDPDNEGGNWKKRHGDLRRASSKKEDELNNRIRELEKEKLAAERANIKYPASEDEFSEWIKKYPVVSKMVDTLVQKRILEGNGMLEGKFSRVQELEQQIARDKIEQQKEKALATINKAHPDFMTLVENDNFQNWIGSQAQWVQDALWENETDAQSAIDAVDLYKARNKVRDPKQEAQNASSPPRSSSSTPSEGSDFAYTESGVARMNDAEYERHESKIREAIRDGKFKYDLSAA